MRRDAIRSQVLAPVLRMLRARHVLRVLDVLLLRSHHCEQQVPRTGPLHRSRRKPARHISRIQSREIVRLEADVHEADCLRRLPLWIQLDELKIIDLQKRFGRRPVLAHRKRLLESQLLVEVARLYKVGHAESSMRDPSERRRLSRQLRPGRRRQHNERGRSAREHKSRASGMQSLEGRSQSSYAPWPDLATSTANTYVGPNMF